MYHQKIPSYEGAQPFIYALYCKEDEALVFPILARMYNEGFRVCCAPTTGISSDFHTQQRLAAASNVIMFISQQMSERLRIGDPEVVSAARSPLLRSVVLLGDVHVKNSAFAMSVPDHVEYRAENDSSFWLYVYSNDYFDPCRGPWPEKKLLLREPMYEDISEEVVSEEYQYLENIMSGVKKEETEFDPFDPDQLYPNNIGYIAPQPDELVYIPLERLAVAKSEHDNQLDEVLELINQAEGAVAQSLRQAAENIQAAEAVESMSAIEQPAEEALITEAVEAEEIIEEEIIEAEPKADIIITPVEDVKEEAAAITPDFEEIEQSESETPAVLEEIIPEANISRKAINAADVIRASSAVLKASEPKDEIEQYLSARKRRSSVPVMVRLHPSAPAACRVQPVKRVVERPSVSGRSAMHLSAVPVAGSVLPPSISDSISFEQYVRDIARSVVVNELPAANTAPQSEEQTVSTRKFRQRSNVVPVVTATAPASAVNTPEPPIGPQQIDLVGVEEDKPASKRKSRFPHQNSGLLAELMESLRQRRIAAEDENTAEISDNGVKQVSRFEAVVSESADLLQNAVERFIEVNSVPARMVVPHMVRRYREQ